MNTVIPDVALIDNSEERAPLVLVLDCSGSMSESNKIGLLNDGLKTLADELKEDPITARCGRILVIAFGGDNNVEIMGDWTDAMDFKPPELVAGGMTPIGAAMRCALDEIETQKTQMKSAGVPYKRPIVMLLSDGEPTDDWQRVAADCKNAESMHKVNIMAIGIGDAANRDTLGQFSNKGALNLSGLKFKELFVWLSRSIQAVSRAPTGGTVQLNPVDSWAQMTT
ncbi:MAG: VWA domain-containing protein [Betaproteobacteria bacterium]|nr:VWA domain-containing protein [Betaproteobacteria bacterium]